jgi:hypothetical protein
MLVKSHRIASEAVDTHSARNVIALSLLALGRTVGARCYQHSWEQCRTPEGFQCRGLPKLPLARRVRHTTDGL